MLRAQHRPLRIASQARPGHVHVWRPLRNWVKRPSFLPERPEPHKTQYDETAGNDEEADKQRHRQLQGPQNPSLTRQPSHDGVLRSHDSPLPSSNEQRPSGSRIFRPSQQVPQPSLIERLFPEQFTRHDVQQTAAREIPRLPVDTTPVTQPVVREPEEDAHRSAAYRKTEALMKAGGEVTSVLVLRNASPNLTEDDFRRLIPQGRHIEGWTLSQGDIVKVIPGRNLATLAPDGCYYLIFSSPLNAFTYQRHVTRIHLLAAQHTPSGPSSPFSPAPGTLIDGIDVHSALSSYNLVPPGAAIELRQLRPPLSPVVDALVRHQGYPSLVARHDRMPFEARLTLDGPQLSAARIRHILMQDGRARALGWSGGDGLGVHVSRWEPKAVPSALDMAAEKRFASVLRRTEEEQAARDYRSVMGSAAEGDAGGEDGVDGPRLRRRAPNPVFILGFHAERAAQMFVHAWNRRPMFVPGEEEEDKEGVLVDGDVPPIANVQMLW